VPFCPYVIVSIHSDACVALPCNLQLELIICSYHERRTNNGPIRGEFRHGGEIGSRPKKRNKMDNQTIEDKVATSTVEDSQILDWIATVNKHHSEVVASDQAIIDAKRNSLTNALVCGEYLNKCKREIKHSKLGRFIQTHFQISHRTCNRYMRLDKEKDKLRDVKSLRGAYILLKIIKDDSEEQDDPVDCMSSFAPVKEAEQVDRDNGDPTVPENEDQADVEQPEKKERKMPVKEPYRDKAEVVLLYKPSSFDIKKKKKPCIEFRLGDDGKFNGIDPATQKVVVMQQYGLDDIYNCMTDFLRWYQGESQRRLQLVDQPQTGITYNQSISLEEAPEQAAA